MSEGDEEGVSLEEVRRALRKLKDGKAELDRIPGEAWRYGGEEMEGWVWEFVNRVWRAEGGPESWRTGVIVPILKKEEGRKVKDYRGVTLMSTLYKVYGMVLPGRGRVGEEGNYSANTNKV